MTDPAAMQAEYVDYKNIKTRGVLQIHLEIPAEHAMEFLTAFGMPSPSQKIAITVLNVAPQMVSIKDGAFASADLKDKLEASVEHEKAKGGKLAQQAGILCNEVAFWTFCNEKLDHYTKAKDEPTAAQILRDWCLVGTRRELDHNPEAARKFLDLRASYNAWASQ